MRSHARERADALSSLEDEVRLRRAHRLVHRDVLEHDVAQRRGILDRDVHEEVVLSRDVEHLDHAGRAYEGREEPLDPLARVATEPHADDGLERQSETRGIEQCAHTGEHAARPERADAVGGGRFGDAEIVGERLVRASRLAHERGEKPQVEFVERRRGRLRIGQVHPLGSVSTCGIFGEVVDTGDDPPPLWTVAAFRARLPAMSRTPHPDTLAVHAGRDDLTALGVHAPPIDLSSTYPLPDVEIGGDSYEQLAGGGTPFAGGSHVYARLWNPTVARFEDGLARLEGAEAAVAFSSGMAAVTAAVLAHATSRGLPHVLAVRPLYGGTDHLLATGLLGTTTTFCEADQIASHRRDDTGLVVMETPANPTLDLVDIARVVAQAGEVPVLVDNTFATPVLQNPLAHGAAMSLHSATKYLGGHGDVIGGVIACSDTTAAMLRPVRAITGAILHPLAAYLLHRGLPTLPLRVRAQQATADRIARWLHDHAAVAGVFYPGLSGSPLVGTQMRGGGAMVAVRLRGGYDAAARIASALRVFSHAVSLGGVDSLVQHPAALTHRPVAPEARPDADILRFSIGLEHVDDLIDDLSQAFAGIAREQENSAQQEDSAAERPVLA